MYLDLGVVTLEGMDQDGQVIYSINEVSARELAPELWAEHQDHIDRMLLDMYNKDLVSVEYDENLSATMVFRPEAKEVAREHGLIEFDRNQEIPNN